jgi:hypothetical protein
MVNILAIMMMALPFDRKVVNAIRVTAVITFTYYYILCLVHRRVSEIVENVGGGNRTWTEVVGLEWDHLTDPEDEWLANEARRIWLDLVMDTFSRIRDARVHPRLGNPVWFEDIARVYQAMGYALLHPEYAGRANRLMGITSRHKSWALMTDQGVLARIGLRYLFSRTLFIGVRSRRGVSPSPAPWKSLLLARMMAPSSGITSKNLWTLARISNFQTKNSKATLLGQSATLIPNSPQNQGP